ncbi:hypothetical protein F8388_000666 [Cannabis sativa]|uniref:Uncharacterized protein n=1 Tax=Cannabis sativa TaxID=3483 RepID=A0A7J6HDF7_CANSA|nr:hypothetical protein F8388_000666 [Cannabis sativa]
MQIHSNIPDDEIPKVGFSIRRSKTNVYTPAAFRMFEVEFSKAYSCVMELIAELGVMREYKLTPNDDVDACLEEDTVGRKEENHNNSGINTTIKGIKTNNKRIRGSSSTRPKNALEKMRKKTKVSQVFNNNNQINMALENSNIQISMTELLLQAEKTPIVFEDDQSFKNI